MQAGDTIIFTEEHVGYPSSAYYLDFILTQNGIPLLTTRASASGAGFVVTISANASASLTPGRAKYVERVTEIASGNKSTICSGWTTIIPDPTAKLLKTSEMLALDDAKAKMRTLLEGDSSVTLASGGSFTAHNIQDLQKIIDRLTITVKQQLCEMGVSDNGGSRVIIMRPGPPRVNYRQ